MKKNFSVILLFLFAIVFSQHSENRFDQESESAFENTENANTENKVPANNGPVIAYGPGGPGEPVPINQNLGALIITALGIIIYTTRKKRNLLS